MTTLTQQDPIDRFTLRIEELRSVPGVPGPARLVRNLLLNLFMSLVRLLSSLAEQARTGTLPDTAPAPQAGAQGGGSPRLAGAPASPRVWPPDAWGGSMMHEPFEQPELHEPIAEPPCRMPEVELPARQPRPAPARTAKHPSEPAPARPLHADTGTSPPCRGAAILWTTDAGLLGLDSKKWVCADGD